MGYLAAGLIGIAVGVVVLAALCRWAFRNWYPNF